MVQLNFYGSFRQDLADKLWVHANLRKQESVEVPTAIQGCASRFRWATNAPRGQHGLETHGNPGNLWMEKHGDALNALNALMSIFGELVGARSGNAC